jgi:hypothetical protein
MANHDLSAEPTPHTRPQTDAESGTPNRKTGPEATDDLQIAQACAAEQHRPEQGEHLDQQGSLDHFSRAQKMIEEVQKSQADAWRNVQAVSFAELMDKSGTDVSELPDGER